MKKVLLVQPCLLSSGGASAVAAWMAEALKKDNDLTVLTWQPVDLEAVNTRYGTSLRASDFTAFSSPRWLRRIIALDPNVYSIQGFSLLMRLCKMVKDRYHVIISAGDELDVGCKAIQYLHYPYQCSLHNTLHPPAASTAWARFKALRGRFHPWLLSSGFSFARMKQNLTLVNSDWTGSKVKECYGITAQTLYPPVPGNFPAVPWSDRENGFVCISKIASNKKLEHVIDILAAIRTREQETHLHIIGFEPNTPEGRQYQQRINQLIRKHSSWVKFHNDPPRGELARLVARHKYGIHRKENEHFGMAVAEMMRGGCIVFVHRSGGPLEIIGHEDRLSYETDEDAVNKIAEVVSDCAEQARLHDYLAARKDLFSTTRFVREMSETVQHFVSQE
jgi:glycosyltransferase involved in cell wall biosynthesis